jgi:squalene-hopene/tetraprenyl-beta-curcumene cyclase
MFQKQTLLKALEHLQKMIKGRFSSQGFIAYPLECDITISAETILLMHAIDWLDLNLQQRLCDYIQSRIVDDGWQLYPEGPYDLSASIKGYFALKCVGIDPGEPFMERIAKKIRLHGGLKNANVFTRCTLATFGCLNFDDVPWMPIEMILQPRWSPFHLSRFSYWARVVVIPLSITITHKFSALNPKKITLDELLVPLSILPPKGLKRFFFYLDRHGRKLDRLIPSWVRSYAEKKALDWIMQHDNGVDGLGGIYTAMDYQIKALLSLGFSIDHEMIQNAIRAIKNLEVRTENQYFIQPCISVVWDTAIATHGLIQGGLDNNMDTVQRALEWLESKQLRKIKGDWSFERPSLKGGGWAFQFNNPFYPDLDDTAIAAWAMVLVDKDRFHQSIHYAKRWLQGMQSKNGGFAAFNADQMYPYLNLIPFADHQALQDPPTEDVTGRVLAFFGELNDPSLQNTIIAAVNFLRNNQREDGSWWGRWGTNYLYGTFCALVGLSKVKMSLSDSMIEKGVRFILDRQHSDGGWGESCDSYQEKRYVKSGSSRFHTAIAIIALIHCGLWDHVAVKKGIEYLVDQKNPLKDPLFNAPGFPRVFYLKYHGYDETFVLWALGLYSKHLENY